MTTTEQSASQMDAVGVLTSDHRSVDQLFTRLEGSRAGAGQRDELIQQVVRELSIHAVIEEQVVYPVIRDEVRGGEQLADQAIDEHQRVKEMLARLERLHEGDAEVDTVLRELIPHVRQHLEEEEGPGGLFHQLRSTVGRERLQEMGEQLRAAKKMAPTHPHPRAANTPPGNIVGGGAAAIVDKARDALQRG